MVWFGINGKFLFQNVSKYMIHIVEPEYKNSKLKDNNDNFRKNG